MARLIPRVLSLVVGLLLLAPFLSLAQSPDSSSRPADSITLTVVDENGLAIADAQVTLRQLGAPPLLRQTDYAGHCSWALSGAAPYTVLIQKPGFYQSSSFIQPEVRSVRIVLAHEQIVQQEVNVIAAAPAIDPEQVSDRSTMNTAEIVNVPYPTNRDIRNLLPFTPGVVAGVSGQVHVAGGETYMTLDTLDTFDIRSPIDGTLALRFSTDAVRSIDTETTRLPAEYGRATGGVIAFNTGMGDNRHRFNTTDFLPSFHSIGGGVHFDKLVPRVTFSGPIRRSRSWYFDALDTEYDYILIPELPSGTNSDNLVRGTNLAKLQFNLGSHDSLTAGLLFNDYHSPYEGISAIVPQQSTDNHDAIAWMPWIRNQHGFSNGIVLDAGLAVMRYREGWEPHGSLPYEITPELPAGSNPETLTSRSQRIEGNLVAYFPERHWAGSHQLKSGVDLDRVTYDEVLSMSPVNYLREDRSLTRLSDFPPFRPFGGHNIECGFYVQDRWIPLKGLLVAPGIRFDWDSLLSRAVVSPRFAFEYSPPGSESSTKITGGIGLYYEHTQLEYLARASAGIRYDIFYAADGVTPITPQEQTAFSASPSSLHEPHALNWSAGFQQRLPGQVYGGFNYVQKRVLDLFVYANQSGTGAQPGNFALTNSRQDRYRSFEVNARRTFAGGYTLFGSYMRSSATTDAALDYNPLVTILGVQQGGPLHWDAPNRIVSWGWLPAWLPKLPAFKKNWDLVYSAQWNTGFPFDSVDSNAGLVGAPGSHRFPDFLSVSPGIEWRFHFRGRYFGLRGMVENITGASNPYVVYNNVDSPLYNTFSQPLGRAFTSRIRLIQ